jgi:hypothetical protein
MSEKNETTCPDDPEYVCPRLVQGLTCLKQVDQAAYRFICRPKGD